MDITKGKSGPGIGSASGGRAGSGSNELDCCDARVQWLLSALNSHPEAARLVFGSPAPGINMEWSVFHVDRAIEAEIARRFELMIAARTDTHRLKALLAGLHISADKLDDALNRGLKPRGRVEFLAIGAQLPVEDDQ